MFKLFVVACILATVYAAPAPGVVLAGPVVHAPVAHVAHVAHPVAVSHSSSHIVHSAPVVKHVAVHHAPVIAHHVPVVHAAPVVAHHVVAAPIVKHALVAHPAHHSVVLHH